MRLEDGHRGVAKFRQRKRMRCFIKRPVVHFVGCGANDNVSLVRRTPDTLELICRHPVQTSNNTIAPASVGFFTVRCYGNNLVLPRRADRLNNVVMSFTVSSAVCRSKNGTTPK
ncbi:hypothetical protein PsorP6_015442 [Peronosclerospora sorghi]|uniref:Uncharacterized protein n=1 Tax=Peronosclerospora sorghi TaxID=230839 RepID=A0ACC0WQW7_9STRA|nr:hypothetical protein PsorP6_015442 [Peronosclerospora sorghi]